MHHVEIGAAWLRNPFGTVNPDRRVRASRAGLDIDGQKFLPHDAIESAFYAPRQGARGRVIVIAKGRPRMAIEVLTRDEAKRLLDALGLDAGRKQLTFTSQSLVSAHGALSLLSFIFALFVAVSSDAVDTVDVWPGSVAFHGAIFFSIAALLYWLVRPSVVVGTDGIAVRQTAVGGRRFIPYEDIVRVRHVILEHRDPSGHGRFTLPVRAIPRAMFDHALVVHRKSGDDVRVRLKRGERNEDDAAGVVERIQEAIEARKSHEIPATIESMLERGDRSVGDWIDALRRIRANEEVQYRVAAIDRESLFGAVEDPTKKPETRIAAAIALGADLGEDGRARLRVSAETVAEPKLRVGLEQVADGVDAEALAEILEDLDATRGAEG